MKQKLLILVLLITVCAAFVVACGGEDTPNINNLQSKYTTTPAPVTTRVTTPQGSLNTYDLSSSSLNMIPWRVESADASIAKGAVLSDGRGIQITGISAGKTTLTVYDDFGHALALDITVNADRGVTCGKFEPFSEPNSRNIVFDCGAIANDGKADTAAIQAAIDELSVIGGGKVYIPRGTYESGLIEFKENIHLVLAGTVEDATVGYTAEVKKRVDSGEFAVIKALDHDMFHNWKKGTRGVTGVDNYSITGGVLDMQGKSRCILFVCADNASLTNVIMKDCLNDHAIQVTGSTNITIKNVMFAGYNTGGNLSTGEEVQVEAAVEGATGISGMFGEGEKYFCKNVVIDNCYFGKSDKYGSQTIAIGHHGHRELSDVDGYTISNCVFDNNRNYSIKTTSYSNVKIINNTFISDGDNRAKGGVSNFTFIYVQSSDGTVTAPALDANKKPVNAVLAYGCSRQGHQNVQISGNSFTMNGSKVIRRVIIAESKSYNYGAKTVNSMLKHMGIGNTAVSYTGYIPVRNVIYNMSFTNNRITVNCTETEYEENLLYFENIYGLTYSGNTITSAVDFSDSYGDAKGVKVVNCVTGNDMYTRTIEMTRYTGHGDLGVSLAMADGRTVKLLPSGTQKLVIKSPEGRGSFELVYEDNGDLSVKVTANNGYAFAGWTVESTGEAYAPTGETAGVSSALTLVAQFERK